MPNDKQRETFPTLRKLRKDNPGTQLASELASILGLADYGTVAPSHDTRGKHFGPEMKDHLWRMYKEGQISADHTARQVFDQMLDSLAEWLAQQPVTASSTREQKPTIDITRDIFAVVAGKFRDYPLAVRAVEECQARLLDAALAAGATPTVAASASGEEIPGPHPIYPHPDTLWVVWFEDKDHGHEVFFGHGAEDCARRRYEQANHAWSCHLLVRVPTERGVKE